MTQKKFTGKKEVPESKISEKIRLEKQENQHNNLKDEISFELEKDEKDHEKEIIEVKEKVSQDIEETQPNSEITLSQADVTIHVEENHAAKKVSEDIDGGDEAGNSLWWAGGLALLGGGALLLGGSGSGDGSGNDGTSGGNDDSGNGEISEGTGVVTDGPIQGAKLYIDTNANGIYDEGDRPLFTSWNIYSQVQTDENGAFTLPEYIDIDGNKVETASLKLVAHGGVDTVTGAANTIDFSAPSGYRALNPITSSIAAYMEANGVTAQEAEKAVEQALGLPDLDYSNVNLADPGADIAAQKAAAIIASAALVLSQSGANADNTFSYIAENIGSGGNTDQLIEKVTSESNISGTELENQLKDTVNAVEKAGNLNEVNEVVNNHFFADIILEGQPRIGDTLTGKVDFGDTAVSDVTYQWQGKFFIGYESNGQGFFSTAGNPWQDIKGETGLTYSASAENRSGFNHSSFPEVRLAVTYKDTNGGTQTVYSEELHIQDYYEPGFIVVRSYDEYSFRINENSANGTVVGHLLVFNVQDDTSYSIISGNDSGAFKFDSATGNIVVADVTKLDYESTSYFGLTVQVSNGVSLSAYSTETVDVRVINLNDTAPTITSGAIAESVVGNSGAGQIVYTVTSTDDDSSLGAKYSLKEVDDHASFSINETTGEVTLLENPDPGKQAGFKLTVIAADGAGNSSEQAVTIAIAGSTPVINEVSIDNAKMKVGDVLNVTIKVEDDKGEAHSDISGTIGGFELSNLTKIDNTTYTAQFTISQGGADVPAGSDIPVNFTIDNAYGVTSKEYSVPISQDSDGIDANGPVVTEISIPDRAMVVGSLVSVEIKVNDDDGEYYEGISGTVGGFALSGLSRINSTTYTAQFTITNGGTDVEAGSDIPVSFIIYDSSGSPSNRFSTPISQDHDSINANSPVINAVSIPNAGMGAGDVVNVTIKVDDDGGDTYKNVSGTIAGYNLSNLSKVDNTTYKAQFTVADSGTGVAADADIPVSISLENSGGSPSSSFTTPISQNNDRIDFTSPVISSVSIPDAAMSVGDVVTATITVDDDGGDSYTNISGTIGGFALSNLTRVNSTTYEADFTITHGGTDVGAGSDIPVTFTLDDSVGNTSNSYTTAISQGSDPIDATAPVISNVAITDASMNIGDTVTVTITVEDDGGNPYSNLSGTVGGFALSNLVRAGNTSYSAQFTITNGGTDVLAGENIPVHVTLDDQSGGTSNPYTTAISQGSDPIDANPPVITAVSIPDTGMAISDVVTVTITVDDDGGDTYTNLSGTAAGYALSSLTRVNSTTYTAQFTITQGGTDVAAGSDIPVSFTLDDSAGNTSSTFNTPINQASDPIDANKPVISGVSIPNSAMVTGDTVTVTINVADDGGDTYTNLSGTVAGHSLSNFSRTNSTTYTAEFTISDGDSDVAAGDNHAVNVTIEDSSGNTSDAYTTAISQNADPIDTSDPSVAGLSITGATGVQNNTLNQGDEVSVTVTMDESTIVNTTGGIPYLNLNIGGSTVQAAYDSGSGSTSLVFKYTIQAGQTDANGISIGADSLNLNGGTLQDAVGNDAVLTHNAVADNGSYIVDTTGPSVTGVGITGGTGMTGDTLDSAGDTVSVTVTMDENTIVTGTPQLALNIGGTTKQADYDSGSGSTELVFTYTIEAGLEDTNGISVDADSLSLNFGALKDAAGNDATLTHGVVADNSSYKVDIAGPLNVEVTASDTTVNGFTAGADTVKISDKNLTGIDLTGFGSEDILLVSLSGFSVTTKTVNENWITSSPGRYNFYSTGMRGYVYLTTGSGFMTQTSFGSINHTMPVANGLPTGLTVNNFGFY